MKAFLSHSSRDKPLVEEIAEHLGAAQVELDSRTFESGLLNVDAIQSALKRSSIFVLFLTRDGIKASAVRRTKQRTERPQRVANPTRHAAN